MILILILGFINFGCGIPIIKKKKRGEKKNTKIDKQMFKVV